MISTRMKVQHYAASLFLATTVLAATTTTASARTPAVDAQAAAKQKEPVVTLVTKPNPPVGGMNEFTVTITGVDGKPIAGADVTVTFVMPAMPAMKMAEMKNSIALKPVSDKPADAGKYSGKGQVMMAGTWDVTVTAKVKDTVVAEKKLKVTAK